MKGTGYCIRCAARLVESPGPGRRPLYCDICRPIVLRERERGRNDYKREHEQTHRASCPDCGQPMGAGTGYKGGRGYKRCADCVTRAAHDRTARWLELRAAGLNNLDIAAQEGVSACTVAAVLCRARVARFPDLTWLPAPYAAARGVAV